MDLLAVLKNEEVLAVSDDPLGLEAFRLEDIKGTKSSIGVFVGQMQAGKFAVVMFSRGGGPNKMTLETNMMHDCTKCILQAHSDIMNVANSVANNVKHLRPAKAEQAAP